MIANAFMCALYRIRDRRTVRKIAIVVLWVNYQNRNMLRDLQRYVTRMTVIVVSWAVYQNTDMQSE
jgi:hypothetical protein